MWHSCIVTLKFPKEIQEVADISLQIILKRVMKNVIDDLITVAAPSSSPLKVVLSLKDLNVIRYNSWIHSLKNEEDISTLCQFF